MNRVAAIELLRGIAVSMVVLYHLYAVQVRYFGENHLPVLFQMGSWGVDIFFVLSGVVMYKSVYGRAGGVTTWSFLRARIARIYPAYWVITLVIFTIAQVRPSLVNASYEGRPNLINSLALFPDVTHPWLNVGWSLIYEMWFYLLLGTLLLVRKSLALTVLGAYGLFLLLAGGMQEAGPTIKLITDPLILEFLLGFALGAAFFQTNLYRKQWLLLVIAAFPFLLFLALMVTGADLSTNPLERFITFGLPALSTVALALHLDASIERSVIFKPVIFIGTVSYSIYLSHVLFLNAFLFTTLRVLNLGLPTMLANISCFLFVVFVGSMYYWLIEKPSSTKFKQLLT